MSTHLLNVFLVASLTVAAFVVYSKIFGGPAHTDPAIPIPYTNKEGIALTSVAPETPKPAALSFGTPAIPLMDRAVPATFETATFALG
ncbi:MAG: hypothetical protein WCT04_04035 [Planctomycetota bacterium]